RRGDGSFRLARLLDRFGREKFANVVVEGGATTLGAFFDQRLVDEIHVYVAPRLIGGRDAPAAIGGVGCAKVADATRLPGDARMKRLGDGWLVESRL
ncbi:MAG: riboflavin biosynthesis protein RibD, partial [Planctomycetota bacterium]